MKAMSLGPYASFIVTAYALVAVVRAVLIGWIAIDYRSQKAAAARARGERRDAALRPQRDGHLMSDGHNRNRATQAGAG